MEKVPPWSPMPAPLTCKWLWQGISGEDLNKELEKFAEDMRKNAINKLSRDGKLNIQKKDGAVWFHYKEDAGESARSVQPDIDALLLAQPACHVALLVGAKCSAGVSPSPALKACPCYWRACACTG